MTPRGGPFVRPSFLGFAFVRLAAVVAVAGALLPVMGRSQGAEPLLRWPYYKEISLPPQAAGLLDAVLDVAVLDKSREDHADLRLYDANGREVPYALRILRAVRSSDLFEANEFNRGLRQRATEISFDLENAAAEHNQVEVDSAGENFRRRVEVEGSHDATQWSTLVSDAYIFRFVAAGGKADEPSVPYPVSRYRYLRVRVHPDPQVDETPPRVHAVRIRRTLERAGETLSFPAEITGREATRENGRDASVYPIRLGGRIPLHALRLQITEGEFSRPYRLEAVSDNQERAPTLARGYLIRHASRDPNRRDITFDEQFAAHLRLTVTDDRNLPLTISSVTAESAARQVVFDASQAAGPLKLYYGNVKAPAPHYDFAASLPRELPASPRRLALGDEHPNPIFEPEPAPLTERSPWLIYAVLGVASLALFVVLWRLARTITPER